MFMTPLGPIPKVLIQKEIPSTFSTPRFQSHIEGPFTSVVRLLPYQEQVQNYSPSRPTPPYLHSAAKIRESTVFSPDTTLDSSLDETQAIALSSLPTSSQDLSVSPVRSTAFSGSPVRRFFSPSVGRKTPRHIETIEADVRRIYKLSYVEAFCRCSDPSIDYTDTIKTSLTQIRDELLQPSYSLTEEALRECAELDFGNEYAIDFEEGTSTQKLAKKHALLFYNVNKSLIEINSRALSSGAK